VPQKVCAARAARPALRVTFICRPLYRALSGRCIYPRKTASHNDSINVTQSHFFFNFFAADTNDISAKVRSFHNYCPTRMYVTTYERLPSALPSNSDPAGQNSRQAGQPKSATTLSYVMGFRIDIVSPC
jgi:hypothetical protein